MLRYTGHPLVDVGVATITAFAGKRDPAELTEQDLDTAANYLTKHYTVNPMQSFLTTIFPNSGFVQPSYKRYPEKRLEYAEMVLRGYRSEALRLDEPCVFCGEPAMMYAYREHVPLLGSVGVINFYAEGLSGLPICGGDLLCVQAFPLGSIKCEGRVLFVHTDNDEMTYEFAKRFLNENRRAIHLIELAGTGGKITGAKYPKTVLVENLLDIERERRGAEEVAPCSVTAYWLTNYGTSADIDIFHLPLPIIRFLLTAKTAKYYASWEALVNRAWHDLGTKESEEGIVTFRRNWLYEDLFDLPQEAPSFLRRYFLRRPIRKAKGVRRDDPRLTYSLKDEAALVSWDLMTLFLREVMNMDRGRIEAIRQLGDRLANYVQTQDARLFNRVFMAQRYPQLRLELLRANTSTVKQGEPPLLTFDNFIEIFEEGEELARRDWSLARDLVLVRMIEQLYVAGWFKQHEEELEEAAQNAAALD